MYWPAAPSSRSPCATPPADDNVPVEWPDNDFPLNVDENNRTAPEPTVDSITNDYSDSNSSSSDNSSSTDYSSSSTDCSESSDSSDSSSVSSESSESSESSDEESEGTDSDESERLESPKVYPGCELSQDEGVLEVMKLFLKHKMEKVEIGSVLKCVRKFIPKVNKMPATQYSLFEHVLKLSPVAPATVHFCCSYCHMYLGTVDKDCDLCHHPSKKFYQLSISDQLRNLFENHGLAAAMDKYLQEREAASTAGIFSDLGDGSEFKRARIPGRYNVTTLGHSDGINISESSFVSMHPFELVISELPPHLRYKYVIICSIWIDEVKPTFNTYLKPSIDELKMLGVTGVEWTHPKTKQTHTSYVTLPSFCVDAPVRCSLQNCQSFNSKYGCNICEQKTKKLPAEPVEPGAKKKKRRRVFTFEENESRFRTKERMDVQGRITAENRKGRPGKSYKSVKGVKGDSIISSIPGCDRSTAVYPEYMHMLMCLLKEFMTLWFEKDGPWSLKNHQDKINAFLLNIRVPDFLTRVPRSTDCFSKWKANELRSFLLYFSLIILSQCMSVRHFQHWMLLVSSFYLLLQDSVSMNDLGRAKIMMNMFCRQFPDLYHPQYYTYYMHNLLHLHVICERNGPLWCNSAFQFESFNGTLAKFIHGTKHQDIELINNVRLAFGVEVLTARVSSQPSHSTVAEGTAVEFRNLVKGFKFTAAEKALLLEKNFDQSTRKIYYRAVMNRQCYTSSIYTRQKKRNNFTICYTNSLGQRCYGEVKLFCVCSNSKKMALITCFNVEHQRVFRHIETDSVITHIVPISHTDRIDMINVENIVCKVIRVEDYVCFRPNKFEVNL